MCCICCLKPDKVRHGDLSLLVDVGNLRCLLCMCYCTMYAGFQDIGARNLKQVGELREEGRLRMEVRSPAAQREGGVSASIRNVGSGV